MKNYISAFLVFIAVFLILSMYSCSNTSIEQISETLPEQDDSSDTASETKDEASSEISDEVSEIPMINVKDFGENSTEAIEKAIRKAKRDDIVFIPEGTYYITETIKLKANITLKGEEGKTILIADKTLPLDSDMITVGNNNTLSGIIFDGDNTVNRIGNLVNACSLKNIIIENCSFLNNEGIALTLGGSNNVTIKLCRFENNGLPKPSQISRPALWADKVGNVSASDITVDNCLFRNNKWSGCYFMPKGGTISNCFFIDNGESSIYTNCNGDNISYIDNYISGARKSNISASGIEIAASNVTVSGNIIQNCGHEGISLTNTQNVTVNNNYLLNNGQQNGNGGIFVYVLGKNFDSGLTPDNITVKNNTFANISSMEASQSAGIQFWKHNEADCRIENIAIENNTFGVFKGDAIKCLNMPTTIFYDKSLFDSYKATNEFNVEVDTAVIETYLNKLKDSFLLKIE